MVTVGPFASGSHLVKAGRRMSSGVAASPDWTNRTPTANKCDA
jgi:hypothetical protein